MTSAEPTGPSRPADPADAALFDAIATEHGIIYGYGLVSAHSTPDLNDLVSSTLVAHRKRREAAIAMLDERSAVAPLPAAGYRLPNPVENPTDAAHLAVQMEKDAAVAWRAVLEQATSEPQRQFAVTALTESAVAAARWNQVLEVWPVTVAFPGGSE
ncbi:MAG: ferritin-like domain-containing protein [Actinobacteria bacterium]|nr:ferritin-like domain-containing protein [Actinomycetota bacterium]